MSLWQICRALVNCGELVSTLDGGPGKLTPPPEKTGSGKLVMPCERMQAAALR
jgi:hypothetical protein